ncbi:hypothetical protein [Gorillibacterium sp. CAU 1737]|uniref:hypothetical protein n=1 Tax=Gorillibacterium sp. CAU 1737 TaxID=3140362 RepID=UPI003261BF16
MNRRWACVLLSSSLLLMGSQYTPVVSHSPAAEPPVAAVHAVGTVPDLPGSEQPIPEQPKEEVRDKHSLVTVNGISLADTRSDVIAKLGVPLEISRDPLIPELELYHYAGLEVTFSGEHVHDLAVPAEEGSLLLDGTSVAITPEAIREALGDPDYVAEDGLVYQRDFRLLKVYLNVDEGRIAVIRYYSLSNT